MTIEEIVKKITYPIYRRIMLVAGVGKIKKTENKEGEQLAQCEILEEEVSDEIPIKQDYGFVSRPIDNSEAIILFLKGDRSQGFIIASDNKNFRKKIEKGEVCLYTDEGDEIYFKRGNEINIKTNTLKMLNGSQAFVKGTKLKEMFATLCSTISGATSGNIGQNAAGIDTIKSAFQAFNGQLNDMNSTKITGE